MAAWIIAGIVVLLVPVTMDEGICLAGDVLIVLV